MYTADDRGEKAITLKFLKPIHRFFSALRTFSCLLYHKRSNVETDLETVWKIIQKKL